MANNIKVIDRQVRGIINVVFYVEHIFTKSKDEWNDSGWFVTIKNRSHDPFHFDHCPTNSELAKLWAWH